MVVLVGAAGLGAVAVAIGGALSQHERITQMWVAAEVRDDNTSSIREVIDYDTGMAHTAHTTNRVPVILVDEERKRSHLREGTAIDVAPTVLQLLGLPLPLEMTGRSLIVDS